VLSMIVRCLLIHGRSCPSPRDAPAAGDVSELPTELAVLQGPNTNNADPRSS
jgi:hypothetical protein